MNIHPTRINPHPSLVCEHDTDSTSLRQIQLEWYWKELGGDPNVFQQLLPLFDVVEPSTDGAIARERFEARLEELKLVGIDRHLAR